MAGTKEVDNIMRITVVSLLVTLVVSALAIQPAQAQFKFKLGKGQEASIGGDMYSELKQKPGFVTKGKDYELVQRIGEKLVRANNLTDYEYRFTVVRDDEVNAFATPGGYLYVNVGLLKYMGYDESML